MGQGTQEPHPPAKRHRDNPTIRPCWQLLDNLELVAEVEQMLRELQADRREFLLLQRQQALLRNAFRVHKRKFDRELRKTGHYLKRNEFRGRRTALRCP